MKRTILAAAVATAPLFLAMANGAHATTEITTSTSTPGGDGDRQRRRARQYRHRRGRFDQSDHGRREPLRRLSLSNNTLTSEGSISFSNLDNVDRALRSRGGFDRVHYRSTPVRSRSPNPIPPRQASTPGSPMVTGPRRNPATASASSVTGPGIIQQSPYLFNTGAITVVGNGSYGILVNALPR